MLLPLHLHPNPNPSPHPNPHPNPNPHPRLHGTPVALTLTNGTPVALTCARGPYLVLEDEAPYVQHGDRVGATPSATGPVAVTRRPACMWMHGRRYMSSTTGECRWMYRECTGNTGGIFIVTTTTTTVWRDGTSNKHTDVLTR